MTRFWILDFRFSIGRPKNEKAFGLFSAALLLALCTAVSAQQPGKIFRIGYLDSSTASGSMVFLDVFRQELDKLGWIEGKNIIIDYRFADQENERLSTLAAELVRIKVDLLVVASTPPALEAKNATTIIPIVMVNASDPVAAGLITSLARPGGNITGNSGFNPELNTKRLEILKDVLPKLTRVGYLQIGGGIASNLQLKELRPAALALNLKLEEIDTQPNAKGFERAFQTAQQKRVDAIMTQSTRPFFAERKLLVDLAGKHRLPAIYPQKEYADLGGLISYGTDLADNYRRTAVYVDKILKGAKPADLPVQQATKFEFVINLKAAKQIGLTIPSNVLARADKVIR